MHGLFSVANSGDGCAYRCAGKTMLIPTQTKRPLPKGHSYPIGAQAISDELATVSQFDELDVSFFWFSKTHYEHHGQILVLAVDFRHYHVDLSTPNCLIGSDWYEPHWSLEVYAVPSDERSAIKTTLLSIGLSIIKNWLIEPRTKTWLDSSHRLELGFNPSSRELLTL